MRLAIDAGPHTIAAAKELGIRGVPVDGGELAKRGVAEVVDPIRAEGLEVCQIGAFGYNPLHPDTAVLSAKTELVGTLIGLAPQTGCRYIVINGGNLHPSGFGHGFRENFSTASLKKVASALKPLAAKAERENVCLSVEPYIKSTVCSPEAFLELSRMVNSPALRINLDVTNFYGLEDMWDCTTTVRHVCDSLKGHYGLVHLKDVALKEGFHIHIDLAPLAQGVTDWALVLSEAAPHVPEDSWVIVEHVGSLEEARASIALVRSAAKGVGVALA
jgi:sugar phosphate isomerase/epimerase